MNHLPLSPTEIKFDNQKKLSRNDIISKKNKTIKKRRAERKERQDQKKYNVDHLVNDMVDGEDSDSELGDFTPPERPVVQQKPQQQDQPTSSYNPSLIQDQLYNSQSPTELNSSEQDNVVNSEGFRSLETSPIQQPYIPYFTNATDMQNIEGPKDKLLEKLNYMIHLLEEQKEEKTGHVTEELILYSFLGVFVIFIVDSFARVGKYVR